LGRETNRFDYILTFDRFKIIPTDWPEIFRIEEYSDSNFSVPVSVLGLIPFFSTGGGGGIDG
jgi:hypothetical protein